VQVIDDMGPQQHRSEYLKYRIQKHSRCVVGRRMAVHVVIIIINIKDWTL